MRQASRGALARERRAFIELARSIRDRDEDPCPDAFEELMAYRYEQVARGRLTRPVSPVLQQLAFATVQSAAVVRRAVREVVGGPSFIGSPWHPAFVERWSPRAGDIAGRVLRTPFRIAILLPGICTGVLAQRRARNAIRASRITSCTPNILKTAASCRGWPDCANDEVGRANALVNSPR